MRRIYFVVLISLLLPAVYGQPTALSGAVESSPTLVDMNSDPVDGLEIVVGASNDYMHAIYSNGTKMLDWLIEPTDSDPLTIYMTGLSSPALVDLNGDGFKEILVGGQRAATMGSISPGYIWAWRRNGTQIWKVSTGVTSAWSSPAVADIDGDGNYEVFIGNYNYNLYALRADGSPYWNPLTLGGNLVSTPAIGDLDGDGKREVVIASSDGIVRILKWDGSILNSLTTGGIGVSSSALGDLDGDGKPEIISPSTDGKVYAWHGDGTPVSGWPVNAGSVTTSSPAIGDLDDDGDLEVVILTDRNDVYAFHGDGTLLPGFPLLAQEKIAYGSPALADLDGDGILEVIFGASYRIYNEATGVSVEGGKVYAWHLDGTLVEGYPKNTSNWVKSSPAVADIDGDDKNEVVIGSDDGNLYIWDGTGKSDNLGWPRFHYNERNTRLYSGPTVKIMSPLNGSSRKIGPVSFTASANDVDGYIDSYEWSSSIDGALSSSSSFTRNLSLGKHLITLKVRDNEGKVSRTRAEITIVENQPPTANIISPSTGTTFLKGAAITFSGQGTDSDGVIASYEWSSNKDGVLGTGSNITMSTLSVGSHTITLTVKDDDGASATTEVSLRVNNPPSASITSPSNNAVFNLGDSVSLVGVGSDSDGSIALYEWDFEGDGSYDYSSTTSGSMTHVYSIAGSRIARLRVTDNDGASGTAEVTLRINDPPLAMINLPLDGDEFKFGKTVSFEGSAYDSDGTIASYLWNSSRDGVISTLLNFNKSDLSIGDHMITFLVTDSDGAKDSDSVNIVIKPLNAPTATIAQPAYDSEFYRNDVISFVGLGSDTDGVIVSYNWTSNLDGLLSTKSNFTTMLTVGEHRITLTVTDDSGLTGSARVRITVRVRVDSSSAAPSVERAKGVRDLYSENKKFFSERELYVAPPQLAGVLGSLGLVPIPKEEAKEMNEITNGRVKALSGDQYEIASELTIKKYRKAEKAVVSRGDLEVDSLAGVAYAKVLGMPILIVEPGNVPQAIKRAYLELGVKSTIVLGGPVAVSNGVAEEMRNVNRIGGRNREETAVMIAEALMTQRTVDTVVITEGTKASGSAVVAAMLYDAPVIYVKGNEVPTATMEFLRKNKSLKIKAVGVTDAAFAKLGEVTVG